MGQGGEEEVELLDALLSERGMFREVLLGRLRRRVGEEEVYYSAEPVEGPSVAVEHKNRVLGYLVSERVEAQKLAKWAGWMGRWMALERRMAELKHHALHDELTGAWNRRYFDQFLKTVLRRAHEQRFQVTLLLFDIDDFKVYNDRYGHAAGDEILAEAARLMQSFVRKQDVVARVGGDEFAVIFWDAEAPRRMDSEHPHSIRRAAKRFQKAIVEHRFPKLGDMAPGTLTISGGLASYPWDGQKPAELMRAADEMLLKSKQQGKNAIAFGPGALKMCNGE